MNRGTLGALAGISIASGVGISAYRNRPVTVRVRGGALRMPRSTYNKVRRYARRRDSLGAAMQVQKGLSTNKIRYVKFPGKGTSTLISKLEKRSAAKADILKRLRAHIGKVRAGKAGPSKREMLEDYFRRRPEATIPVTVGAGASALHVRNQLRGAAEKRRYERAVAAGVYPGSGVAR